tara:strand:+ start:174 stop:437 length:264 start_codon:yes stop_codon:yes gene_type:complete
MALYKTYTSNTSDEFEHNGRTGVIAIAKNSGSGTVTLSHKIGTVDVPIDSFSDTGGAQFVSAKGTLKITTTGFSSGNFTVHVEPLAP